MNLLPVMNYHGIEAHEGKYAWTVEEQAYVVSRSALQEHLSLYQKSGCKTLKTEDLRRWLDWEINIERPLMLTFDDGHISHYEHAVPELRNHGFTALFFVTAGFVGKDGFMNRDQLQDLINNGFEIGSHGMGHIPLTSLSDEDLKREIFDSKKQLEDLLGLEIRSFSIPRGFGNEKVQEWIEKSGYRFAFTSHFALNPKNQKPLKLNRLAVKAGDNLSSIENWIQGRLGSKGFEEKVKSKLRGWLSPKMYDRMAAVKRVMP